MKLQINEFGQVPKQIFKEPHPKRFSSGITEINYKPPPQEDVPETKEKPAEREEVKEEQPKEEPKEEAKKEAKKEIPEEKHTNQDENIPFLEASSKTSEKQQDAPPDSVLPTSTEYVPQSINLDIDYNLKKQFFLLKDFHKKAITSSVFLPNLNSIITGSLDGYVKLFEYTLNRKGKQFFFQGKIAAMTSLNSSSLISIALIDSINIFNYNQGKTVLSFYAHDSPVKSLYFNDFANYLVSNTSEGCISVWDMTHQKQVPIDSYFLFNDSDIVSTDFNADSSFHFALDRSGNAYLNKIKSYTEEVYQGNFAVKDNKALCIKGDIVNLNQFFVGYEKGYKTFDIRMMRCVCEHNVGSDVLNCANDSYNILLFEKSNVELYCYNNPENETKLIESWEQKIPLTHSAFQTKTHPKKDSLILFGNENGDVFFSKP